MSKILIVDDHQLVLDGLRLIIESQADLQLVGEAHNGQEAIDFIKENEVDIILMDLNMPVLNGIEASKKIVSIHPESKILILSMLSDTKLVKKLVKEGIKGYMLKNSGQDEIVDAIRRIRKGSTYFDPHIVELMMSGQSKTKVKNEGIHPSLSRREKEILQLIINEHTSAEIAEKLFISLGTVESHRRNMISKLGVRNTAGLVRAAYEYDILS
jgi:DNA-binding NarL/FixJ family response regulator